MDLMGIGNTRTYIKGLRMRQQWKQKQETGAVQIKGTEKHRSQRDAEYAAARSTLERMRESGETDTELQSAYNKLYSGKKLTASEKELLKEKDPEAYAKVVSMEQERKSFERSLKQCKTKEEVRQLKLSRLSASLTAVGSIEHNPHISQEKKLERFLMENGKLQAQDALLRDFIRRGYYDSLPAETECREAENAAETAEDLMEEWERGLDPETLKKVRRIKAAAAQLSGSAEMEAAWTVPPQAPAGELDIRA